MNKNIFENAQYKVNHMCSACKNETICKYTEKYTEIYKKIEGTTQTGTEQGIPVVVDIRCRNFSLNAGIIRK